MNNIIQINAKEYSKIYALYGGSYITSNTVLEKLSDLTNIKITYKAIQDDKKNILGAYATWKNFLVGDREAINITKTYKYIDIGCPVINIPTGNRIKIKIDSNSKANQLSNTNIINTYINKNNSFALFKGLISSNFKNELKRKWKKFYNEGGEIKNINSFEIKDLVKIYTDLYSIRWGEKPVAYQNLESTLLLFKNELFGHILYLKNIPVAIQLIYFNESVNSLNFELINGGIVKSSINDKMSLGSLLSDQNIKVAQELAKQKQKNLHYSFGFMDFGYKKRWCYEKTMYKN